MDSAIDLSANSTTKTSRHSWITYRLGEFYLNYAEAIFQYTGSADNGGEFGMTACEAVNIIRNRTDVKMPEFPTGLSADAFWNKYQNERMVELAFEGHRFYDLRRWKDGDKLKSIIEMKLTKMRMVLSLINEMLSIVFGMIKCIFSQFHNRNV